MRYKSKGWVRILRFEEGKISSSGGKKRHMGESDGRTEKRCKKTTLAELHSL